MRTVSAFVLGPAQYIYNEPMSCSFPQYQKGPSNGLWQMSNSHEQCYTESNVTLTEGRMDSEPYHP